MPNTKAKNDYSKPFTSTPFPFARPFSSLLCSSSSYVTHFWPMVCKGRSAEQTSRKLLEKVLCPPHTLPTHC